MHQTFYIDIDEEITSVVERLKKARTREIIMVVPKRALLIQSIVNLRILKKEADENGLQLMIVTQDKLGKILIEKAGIFVQQKMDNISDEEIDLKNEKNQEEEVAAYEEINATKNNNERLNQIGSANFYNAQGEKEESRKILIKNNRVTKKEDKNKKEKLTNTELVTDIGSGVKNKVSMDVKSGGKEPQLDFSEGLKTADKPENKTSEKKIEDFFHSVENFQGKRNKPKEKKLDDLHISVSFRKKLWLSGIILGVILLFILSYLFIPKAKIIIYAKDNVKSVDSEVVAKTDISEVDLEKGIIPAKLVVTEEETTESANSTGSKTVSNQKARGMITIYNEYSSQSQPLVATTRFLTDDGKLFRLVSGVTVPGMSGDKPGEIEAQVVADQPGEEYNIEPTEFKIPGFESSGDKYNKFYAKSEKAMTGGGEGTGESKFITAEDITSAKSKALEEAQKAVKQKIKATAGEGAMVIDGAVKSEEAVYKVSNAENDVVDSFQVTVQIKSNALVFMEGDLRKVVADMIAKAGNVKRGIDTDSIKFDFGRPETDFEKGTVVVKFDAQGSANPNISEEEIKENILGKNEEDLKDYLNSFSDIEKAEVVYWPSFVNGRIPFRSGQVSVSLDNN